jgi:hypothetical protein
MINEALMPKWRSTHLVAEIVVFRNLPRKIIHLGVASQGHVQLLQCFSKCFLNQKTVGSGVFRGALPPGSGQ